MADLIIPEDLVPVHVSKLTKDHQKSGVYLLYAGAEVVYVGQSGSMLRRVGEHISDRMKAFDSVAFVPCLATNRLWLERLYISHFKPKHNNLSPHEQRRLSNFSKRSGRRARQHAAQRCRRRDAKQLISE
jgi:excinuclease UvrABC nuclease subunit